MRLTTALLALLFTTPALARPKAAILVFTGKGAKEIKAQVSSAVCDQVSCVATAKVSTGVKADWKKAKKNKVEFLVNGRIVKIKGKDALQLQLLDKPGKPRWAKMLPIRGGKVPAKNLSDAVDDLVAEMGGGGSSSSSAAEEEAPPARETAPEPEAPAPAPVETERAPVSSSESESPADRIAAAESSRESSSDSGADAEVSERPSRKGPVTAEKFAIEVGSDFFSRRLAYDEVQTSNLRSYQASLIIAPHLWAEVYPLAFFTTGFLTGLGLEAGYLTAVGLKSRRTDGSPHPTSLSRLDVGVKAKIRPVAGSKAALIPSLGFRSASFSVGAAEDGTLLDGLPGISYTALVAALGGEVPLGETLLVFARFAYLPVLSSGEIISAAYFPVGSASGLEANLGVGINLTDSFQARVTGQFTRYGMTFQSETGDPYVAAGASDQYLGANLSLRYTF